MPQKLLSDYRSEVNAILGMGSDEQALIDEFVNEGVEEFVTRSQCYQKPFTLALTSGTATYTLGTAILAFKNLVNVYTGGTRWLEQMAIDELDALRHGTDATGGPARYYAIQGGNALVVYPKPGAGETLKGWYVPRPAALAVAGDSPTEIPFEYHLAPEWWALFRAANMDENRSQSNGRVYRELFDEQVRSCRKRLLHKGGRLGRIRLGTRAVSPHDPSQDVWHL